MDLKWDYQLKNDELPNPVIYKKDDIKGVTFEFSEEELLKVLTNKGGQLKTWGGGATTKSPHWIGVKRTTPLHTDPYYPRYTHHLLVYVDEFGLMGLNKESTVLQNNQYLVIDTHSPHKLHSIKRGAKYYLAASIDSYSILPKEEVLPKLIEFVNNTPINANTERITM